MSLEKSGRGILSKRMRGGKEMVIQGDPVYIVTAVRVKGEEGVGIA